MADKTLTGAFSRKQTGQKVARGLATNAGFGFGGSGLVFALHDLFGVDLSVHTAGFLVAVTMAVGSAGVRIIGDAWGFMLPVAEAYRARLIRRLERNGKSGQFGR